jgi:hypothetical protein
MQCIELQVRGQGSGIVGQSREGRGRPRGGGDQGAGETKGDRAQGYASISGRVRSSMVTLECCAGPELTV